MTTLIPSSSSAGTTATTSQATGVEAYEDMFKEITRKLYGEETGHGLHTLGTPIAHVATSGPTLPEGERSFTTLMSDRTMNTVDFGEVTGNTNVTNGNSKDHSLTAFGLAALMQNGFPPPGSILTPHPFNQTINNSTVKVPSIPTSSSTNNNAAIIVTEDQQRWNQQNEDLLQWTTSNANHTNNSKMANSYSTNVPQKSHKSSKRDSGSHNKDASNGVNNSSNNNGSAGSSSSNGQQGTKRYTCSSCPYSTDRRDLYTRHENIHKEEKPFHCYACLKQFNRADHVKKHFLRMHREMNYDINKTRRTQSSKPITHSSPYFNAQMANTHPTASNTNTNNNNNNNSTILPFAIPSSLEHQNTTATTVLSNSEVVVPQQQQHHNAPESPTSVNLAKVKQEKSPKKKNEKRFVCCYCPWTGADNWGLKRHLNTHTKPFVCMLCDYKAARSERLITHVYKVHNKKACSKCNFLADDHGTWLNHQSEAHHGNGFGGNHESGGNWRGNTSHQSHGTTQKRGAERLFQYMEADGSDPEDYNKQLQMAALSRNTASVAQDFHNAGGGEKGSLIKKSISSDPPPAAVSLSSLFASKDQQKFIQDLEEFIAQRLTSNSLYQSSNSSSSLSRNSQTNSVRDSPPAKKIRQNSHDKENTNIYEPVKGGTWSALDGGAQVDRSALNAQMRELFQTLSSHYSKQTEEVKSPRTSSSQKLLSETIEINKILRNNKELTISIKSNKKGVIEESKPIFSNSGDSGVEDEEEVQIVPKIDPTNEDCHKSKRKQTFPRKLIDTISVREPPNLTKIRDKHLNRLVSRQKFCRICLQKQKSLIMPYHSDASLILHNLWRHSVKDIPCSQCDEKFNRPHKLALHQRLHHKTTSMISN